MKPALQSLEPLALESPGLETRPVTITAIVTVTERVDPLAELYEEYAAVLRDEAYEFEFVFVAEPHFESALADLEKPARGGAPIRTMVASRSVGATGLLRMALSTSTADVILTLPSYRQIEASAISPLLASLTPERDMVVAARTPRRDPLINRVQNWAFHLLLRQFMTRSISDVGCAVRAFRRVPLLDVPIYGDFARFLPLVAMYSGLRIVEVPAPQHPSDTKARVYQPGVYLRRFLDLFGLFFLLRFTDKPLRFFGLIGCAFTLGGMALLLLLLVQRADGRPLSDRPLLVLAALMTTLGVQSIALGLIGEMIVHFNAPGRRSYKLRGEQTQKK